MIRVKMKEGVSIEGDKPSFSDDEQHLLLRVTGEGALTRIEVSGIASIEPLPDLAREAAEGMVTVRSDGTLMRLYIAQVGTGAFYDIPSEAQRPRMVEAITPILRAFEAKIVERERGRK